MAKGQIGGNQAELQLEKGEPTGREIAVTAILSTRYNDPVQGATVLFFINNIQVGEEETDENGRATINAPMQDSTFVVSAQVRGSVLTERVQVTIKTKIAVSVKNFDARIVTVDEEKGWERISIRVIPPKRARFRITGEKGVIHEEYTDEHGFALFPQASFLHHTRKMKYVVEVEGVERQEEFPLEAPPMHPLPEPPPEHLSFLRKWWWRLQHNNNWRLVFAWSIVLLWFFFNLFFFGIGRDDAMSAEWSRYQSMSSVDKFFYENWHLRDGISLPVAPSVFGQFFGWLGSWSWWLWFWGLAASIVYIPIAFRDELSRAWYMAQKTVRERREGISRGDKTPQQQAVEANVASVQQRQVQSRERPFWIETLLELFHEIVAEMSVREIARRFR